MISLFHSYFIPFNTSVGTSEIVQRARDSSSFSPICSIASHFAKLPFLCEFTAQCSEIRDQVSTGVDQGVSRRLLSIGLNTKLEGAAII